MTLVGDSVAGDVLGGGAITATGTSVKGNLTSSAGAVTLAGGEVGGNLLAQAAVTLKSGTAVTGTLTSRAGALTLTDSSVGGDVQAYGAITSTNTTVKANLSTRTGAITATDSCIGGVIVAGGAKTITACSNASCSLYNDPVSVVLSPSSGWTATPPAVINGNTITFSGGSAQAQLRSSGVGSVSLAVASSVPGSTSSTVCSTSGCTIAYAESGFIFDVPTLIAARPQSNIALRAVKKSDTSQACVPGFANVTRTLSFTSAYISPGTGTQPVMVNNSPVTSSPSTLNLVFDSTGSTLLTVRYDDAGQMMLTANYDGTTANGDVGLSMSGSDLFVSKPYGLCLQTTSTCTVAGVSDNCQAFAKAGDSFPLRIQAVGWLTDGEPLTAGALCSSHIITHNYDRGAFWRLATPVPNAYTSITGKTSLDISGRLTHSGTANLAQSGADNGDGTERYRWSDETLQYTPALLPLADDYPFIAAIRQGFSAATLTDTDGACFGDGNSCSAYSYDFSDSPGSEVRLGRLRLDNAHGTELQTLDLPLRIETWQNLAGGSFRVEGLDTCTTAAVLQTPALSRYTGQLSQQNYGNDKVTLIPPSAGLGLLRLQPPGINGSVLGGLPATPSWLFYDWNGTGREAATGLARFGIYRGSSPMIFRREVYR